MADGRTNVVYPYTFGVKTGSGAPRLGLVTANFTITVRNPQNTATMAAPTVVEIGGGQYRFDIAAAFTNTHGAGPYGVTIELTLAPTDLITDIVDFTVDDADTLAATLAGLNDISIADVQTALTTQGYTVARAALLDNLDAAISSRGTADPGDAMDLVASAISAAAFAPGAQQIWFAEGAVWLDTVNGTAGTAFPRGTPGDPVSNMADAIVIAVAQGLTNLRATGGVTLTAALTQFTNVKGYGLFAFQITGGGFDIGGVTFEDCLLTGSFLTSFTVQARRCDLSSMSIGGASAILLLDQCSIAGTGIVLTAATIANITLCNCFSNLGVTGIVDLGGGAIIIGSLSGVGLKGDWDFRGAGQAGNTIVTSHLDGGSVTIGATNTAGSSTISGDARLTDASGGGHTVTDNTIDGRHGTGLYDATATVPPQTIRDAMKLAPTAGAPAAGSVDQHLDDIEADTSAIDGRLPADPADESNQLAQHTQTQADIAAVQTTADAIDGRLPTDPADESLQQASHTQTQADIAAMQATVDSIEATQVMATTTVIAAPPPTTTAVATGRTEADGFWKGALVVYRPAAGAPVPRFVDDYENTNGLFRFADALPLTPTAGDTIEIVAVAQPELVD